MAENEPGDPNLYGASNPDFGTTEMPAPPPPPPPARDPESLTREHDDIAQRRVSLEELQAEIDAIADGHLTRDEKLNALVLVVQKLIRGARGG